ncbi:MAG: hypothetical protein AAGE61_11995 [Pseudomonadota bacterium]
MPLSQPVSRTEELLFERERLGIRTLMLMRGLFVLILVALSLLIGVTLFEKIAITIIGFGVLAGIGLSLYLLARKTAVYTVGLCGCLMDLALLSVLPVIWYNSVGGNSVPPSFMLKTQITDVTLVMMVLNALALRPLYPLVITAGGITIHAALLSYILSDPRTIVSADFVAEAFSPALKVDLVLVNMFVLALVGAILAAFTLGARRTLMQGVKLEVTNAQMNRYFSPGVAATIS